MEKCYILTTKPTTLRKDVAIRSRRERRKGIAKTVALDWKGRVENEGESRSIGCIYSNSHGRWLKPLLSFFLSNLQCFNQIALYHPCSLVLAPFASIKP